MIFAEVLLLGAIFWAVYRLGTRNQAPVQPLPETGVRLQQKLHKYRMHGVNKVQMEDIMAELVRRGRADVPFFNQGKPDPEVAAELELMLEETPYVPRELNEPGEDRMVSKSTFSAWLAPRETDES